MSTAPRLTIDLSALVANWKLLCNLSGKAETSAVVKADAYGIGIDKPLHLSMPPDVRHFLQPWWKKA